MLAVLGVLMVIAAGCSSATETADGPASNCIPSSGEWTTGTIEGGRAFRTQTPAGEPPADGWPVILEFHGYTGSAQGQTEYSNLVVPATEAGFMVFAYDGRIGGQAGGQPVERRWDLDGGADSDVDFLAVEVEPVIAQYCGDVSQLFATGFSNGAAFSTVLACERSEVKAIAPVALTIDPSVCDGESVPTLAIHGTADEVIQFDPADQNMASVGWVLGLPNEPVEVAMSERADSNSCGAASDQAVGSDVTKRTWTNCAADTVLYVTEGADHSWPGADDGPLTNQTINASELIVEFFLENL